MSRLERARQLAGAFAAATVVVGYAGWLALSSLLGLGPRTLVSFSILFVTVTFAMSLLFRLDRRRPLLVVVVVTSVLLLQELLLSGEYAFYGFLTALTAMVAFPLAGGLIHRDKQLSYVLQVSGLVFASRVAYVPFPGRFLNISIGLPSLYLLIFLMCLLFISVKKVDLKGLGFQKGMIPLPVQVLTGLSIGVLSGSTEYILLKPPPISPVGDPLHFTIYILFMMMILVSFPEEILFRGLLQKSMSQVLPPWVAIQMTSVQFGLMHLGWRNPIEVLFAFSMGLIMGFLFWKSESLVAPILLHGVGNVVMFSLASVTNIPDGLVYALIASSAASTVPALYLLRKHMPIDYWSSSMEIRRRREKVIRLLEKST